MKKIKSKERYDGKLLPESKNHNGVQGEICKKTGGHGSEYGKTNKNPMNPHGHGGKK